MITKAFANLLSWIRSFARKGLLTMPFELWARMLPELERRGKYGHRESGAFLLGVAPNGASARVVKKVVYYDDVDPYCLVGSIRFAGERYPDLWDICMDEGLTVVGDVHTHPGANVGQSSTDQNHAIHKEEGHVALILPKYAIGEIPVERVGLHQFKDGAWHSWFGNDVKRHFRLKR